MELIDSWTYRGFSSTYDKKLQILATNELFPEKWSSSGKSDFGILRSYLSHTFEKLWSEREKVSDSEKSQYIYEDSEQACFNTGLYDKNWQTVYYYCELNPNIGLQKWRFKDFYNSYTIKFTKMPSIAASNLRRPNYFSNPSRLIYNINLDIIPQWNHILDDPENFDRIPEQIRNYGKDFCRSIIAGQIETVKKRIEANYKTVVPQWYKNQIQLLVPLCLSNPNNADLALVLSLSEDSSQYFGHTCLNTEMAYNNARLIARPESYWLHP